MKRPLLVVVLTLALSPIAVAQDAGHPYASFITEVQEKLRSLGFNPGQANGDFGSDTQAALAQFQLSRTIPASGQLDQETLAELGVKRPEESAAAGGTEASGESASASADGSSAPQAGSSTTEQKPQQPPAPASTKQQ